MNKKFGFILPISCGLMLAACTSTATSGNSAKRNATNILKSSEDNLSLVAELVDEETQDVEVIEEQPEEEIVVEEPVVDKIDVLLDRYESLSSDAFYKVETVESTREDYAYEIDVTYLEKSYVIFFNEVVKEDDDTEVEIPDDEDLDEVIEDDDEEEEVVEETKKGRHGQGNCQGEGQGNGHHGQSSCSCDCVRYTGIIVNGDVETSFKGKRIVKDDYTYTKISAHLDDSKKLTFESYVTDDSVIFTYQVAKGWFVDYSLYFEKTTSEASEAICYTVYDGESFEYYSFYKMAINDAAYYEVEYLTDASYGVYKILVSGEDRIVDVIEEGTFEYIDFEDEEEIDDDEDDEQEGHHHEHGHHGDQPEEQDDWSWDEWFEGDTDEDEEDDDWSWEDWFNEDWSWYDEEDESSDDAEVIESDEDQDDEEDDEDDDREDHGHHGHGGHHGR